MTIDVITNCTGCFACMNKCPQKCISVKKDKMGNIYPEIDTTTCIDCSLCFNICPENHLLEAPCTPLKVYASWSKDTPERLQSSSGALATIYSEFMIKRKGIMGVLLNHLFFLNTYDVRHLMI